MKILSPLYLSRMSLSPSKFRQLIGVTQPIFQLMIDILSHAYAQRHTGRGRKAKLALCDFLFMALKYWLSCCTQLELAVEFDIGEATVHD